MKKLLVFSSIAAFIVLIYFLGPTPNKIQEDGKIDFYEEKLDDIENKIAAQEALYTIKPDNQAEIVWHNQSNVKTPCSVVYLHGFSSSKNEGDPIHREIAEYFGCNLYLARLDQHGLIEDEPMLNLTADQLIKTAKDAVQIGRSIGDKVIVIGTSTGGTLGLYLASQNPEIDALVLYSPNIRVYNPLAGILNDPWGLQIARLVNSSNYHQWELDSVRARYWTNKYRYEALTQLQELLETTMTPETFNKVHQPVLMAYYYKNEEEQDKTVSVPAMLEMYDQLGTPEELKTKIAFPQAGSHVIGSKYTSKSYESVRDSSIVFLGRVINKG